MKLSVVVCVYNTDEEYFEECLHSIFSCTAKNLEVIVVDDGSTKDYSKILAKYNKIKYFKTENQGTLKARIFGAKQATGDYVIYCDSDDVVSQLYYSAMIQKAEQSGADIVLNDWAFQTAQTKYFCKKDITITKNIVYKGDVILEKFMEQSGLQHSFYVLWNKIIKRDVLLLAVSEVEKLKIERLLFAEDVLLTFFVFHYAKILTNTHLGFYFYRIHDSQQISVTTEEKLNNHICSMTTVFDIMEQKLKEWEKFDYARDYFLNWKKLLAYGEYAEAKRKKFKNLVSVIKEKYNLSTLKTKFPGTSKYYDNQFVLPVNYADVEETIKKVYFSNKYLRIYAKNAKFAKNQIKTIVFLFDKRVYYVKNKALANLVLTKEKYSLKQQILHNKIVYKIGVFLFPKGSKIRKKLKSKL